MINSPKNSDRLVRQTFGAVALESDAYGMQFRDGSFNAYSPSAHAVLKNVSPYGLVRLQIGDNWMDREKGDVYIMWRNRIFYINASNIRGQVQDVLARIQQDYQPT